MAKTAGCALSGFVLVKKDLLTHNCLFWRRGVTRMAKTAGCALSGFVLVKKVPGALHFLAKSPGHSFDYRAMNMSHVVNYLYFGNKPSPRRHQARATNFFSYTLKGLSSNALIDINVTDLQHTSKNLPRHHHGHLPNLS